MRIALFSDVHGNLTALTAVLADIGRHAPDAIVFAGDLCLFGPRPAECLRLVRDRRFPAVVGNTDAWLAGRGQPPDKHAATMAWTQARFLPDDTAWLGRLPFGLRFSPTAEAADDLLVVHANPRNWDDIVFPAAADQLARWGHVRQPDAELEPLFSGLTAAVVAYGHLHLPGVRPWGGLTLLNVSSVSMPGDGDGRAKYALVEWRDGRWSATHHRVAYDVAAEADAFRTHQPPRWQEALAAIETEGYYYPQKI